MIVSKAEYHDYTGEGVFVIDDDAVIGDVGKIRSLMGQLAKTEFQPLKGPFRTLSFQQQRLAVRKILPRQYKLRIGPFGQCPLCQTLGIVVPVAVGIQQQIRGGHGTVIDDAVFLGLNTHYFVHFEDGETAEIVQESKIDSIIEKGTEIRLGVKTEKINIFDEKGEYNLVEGVINDYDQYKKEAE